jgi:drug/metabolite transporter (DMT)-like permease
MVTLADSSEAAAAGDRSLFGDALCVASAICYSCYTVIMQRELREDDTDIPALFFGYVGVLVAVGGLPVVVLLHVLGCYDLTALNPTALGLALLNGEARAGGLVRSPGSRGGSLHLQSTCSWFEKP